MKIKKKQKRYLGEGDAPPGTPPVAPPTEKSFKQAEVDGIVQKRIAEAEKKFNATRTADLERLKALETDAGKAADLEKQIEDLNNRYKTKDELAADHYKKEKTSWEKKHQENEAAAKAWRGRYEEQTRDRDLMDVAASKDADAQSPEQLMMLLRPNASVVEKIVDGKATGEFETRVKYKNDKGVLLDVTPAEAVKLMKSDVKRWGNLFNSGKAGGLGANPQQGAGNDTQLGITQEEFTKRYLKGDLPTKVK